jgi:hypothetical protein
MYVTLGLCIGILLLIGLILILVVFVGGKSMAQREADKVKLSVDYIDFMSIDPSTNSVNVDLSLYMESDASKDVEIEPTIATLKYKDKEFATAEIPAQTLKKNVNKYHLQVQSNVKVTDLDVFADMNGDVINQNEVVFSGYAEVTIKVWGLTFSGIKIDRDIQVKGINDFNPEPIVNVIDLNDCKGSTIKLSINATIDNQSQVGLNGVGVLNMSIYYRDDYLGYAISSDPNIGLPRGSHPQVFVATIQNSVTMLPRITKMITGIISKDALFFIVGDNPYSSDVAMLQGALKSLNMSIHYTDGLSKVKLDPKCDLINLIPSTF